jgi:tetratricopeptide (TPR) repeat protein
VGWSFDRLGGRERDVFLISSVSARGFTVDSVAVVAGLHAIDVVEALTALVENSLVQATHDDGATRYSMLEPVRQFAESRLDGDRRDSLGAGLAAWVERFLDEADSGLRSPDELRWSRRMTAELANIRAAVNWAHEQDLDAAARITGRLYWYSVWYAAPEAFDWAAALAERAESLSLEARGYLAPVATLGSFRAGDVAAARQHAVSALSCSEHAGDDPIARFSWEALGNLEGVSGNWPIALDAWERAIELSLAAGDLAMVARNRAGRALGYFHDGSPVKAAAELDRAHDDADRSRNPTVKGMCDYISGEVAAERSPKEALEHLGRATRAAQALGNRYLGAIAGLTFVSTAARSGDPAAALPGFADVLGYFDRSGSRVQQWTAVRSLIETLTSVARDDGRVHPRRWLGCQHDWCADGGRRRCTSSRCGGGHQDPTW